MSTDYKFAGWMGLDKTADQGNLKWQEYEPKKWEETDIDIQVSPCSGVFKSEMKLIVFFIDYTLRNLRVRHAYAPIRVGRDALSLLRWT